MLVEHQECAEARLQLLVDHGQLVDDRIDPVAELADLRFGRVAGVLAHLLVLEAEREFLDLGLERVDRVRTPRQ